MNPLMELTLADIMSRQVCNVPPECTLGEAAVRMSKAHISSILVMSEGKPSGILTERDLLRLLNMHQGALTPVSEVMSAPVLTVPPELDFASAYAKLLNHHIRHLVVTDERGDVIGLASETDFRNHLGANLLHSLEDIDKVIDSELPQLTPDAPLDQALAMMLKDGTSYALVMENALPVGILTERDMAGLMAGGACPGQTPLRDVMHAPVLTVPRRMPVYEMASLMQDRKMRHLVVVDERERVLGVVTLHRLMEAVAAAVMNEQALHEKIILAKDKQRAESLLHTFVQTVPDLVWLKDTEGVYLACNRTCQRFYGLSEAEIVGKTDYDLIEHGQADVFREHDRLVMTSGKSDTREMWITFADDGHRAYVEAIKSPLHDGDGQLIGVMCVARDITERRAATDKIQRLTQLYAALSQCNQAIVRTTTEAELFAQVCLDAVRFGGLKMAWVGMLDADGRQIRPVAWYGEGAEYLQGILISADAGEPSGRGPTGTAVRENRPYWCQNFLHDPATAAWHERAKRFGWRASASLPLCRKGVPVGAFTLYATEVDAFDEESRNLLTEMSGDISYALDNFDHEAERTRLQMQSENERAVLELLARGDALPVLLDRLARGYESLFEGMHCSILLLSPDGLHVEHGAAPSLPKAYCDAVDGQAIGEMAGSCGTAIYTRETVIASDIATDTRWRNYRDIALANGLAAGWSVPIFSTQDQVLGAFALYYSAPRSPLPSELATLERGAHLASLAIERAQNQVRLNKLSQAVEQSSNMIVITDLDANIEYVNAAFVETTGYSTSEAMGQNPRLLQSGKTPKAAYNEMWTHLKAGETWRGELTNRRKDGSEYVESVRISPVRQADGRVVNYLAIKEDITEKKMAEARIVQLAHFDSLTGLPNQILLREQVERSLKLAERNATQLAVLFLDIDHFKNINDTLGHRVGDALLVHLAGRLKSLLREEDVLSRMGGDEFIMLLPDTDAERAAEVASQLIELVVQSCHVEQYELAVTPSIGIAVYPGDGADFDRLYQSADMAMYRAKKEGRNCFRFYTGEMQARSSRRLLLENALRHALVREQFQLHYQPQIDMRDGSIIGAEALLRWQHPELGMVSPSEFIPVAEDSGLILPIGEWVLRTAVRQVKQWLEGGFPAITMAVNLSAVQFREARLPERVMRILEEADLPPQHIELELTESAAMETPLAAIEVMDDLHARGIRMSIDDFGTGYSSLSYLRKFKIGKLKIDQSFVCDLSEDSESRAIVSAIITLASSMGFRTIAEGVETAGQLAFLRLQGCDEVQGYYFSKPLLAAEFEVFMRGRHAI